MTTETEKEVSLDIEWIRAQFPSLALQQNNTPALYLDNPAGTQVPQQCISAIESYLINANSNVHGDHLTSERTDRMLDDARKGMADFLGASSPREIIFGPNMTTLTYALSRAIGRELGAGDEVLVTELDHDANVAPWLDLQEKGVTVKSVPALLEDCTLDMDAFAGLLSSRTRLVALTYASNAVGTVTDVAAITRLAHSVGAMVWVDAVHYGPHGLIDVEALGVDLLVCSAYKFFGPHLGILYGREDILERLQPYQLRPAPHTVPEKYETGTKNHECLAGLVGTLNYLTELGGRTLPDAGETKGNLIRHAMQGIRAHEMEFSAAMLQGLLSVPGLRIYGITNRARLAERVPTFAFTIEGKPTVEVGRALASEGIFCWTGNYYALAIMERLGLEGTGGAVRVGAVHYNTMDEIDRLVETLHRIARS